MERLTPIFVIGLNRSGTKWVSNILCNHPDISGVQGERFTGILETNLLGAFRSKFPNLRDPEEFVGLVELWSKSDFFRLAGASRERIYGIPAERRDHFTLLETVVGDLARRNGARYWLQKTSPWLAQDLPHRFPEARFILVQRDRNMILRSSHYLLTEGRGPVPLRLVVGTVLEEKLLRRLGGLPGARLVRYEALRSDPEGQVRGLCDFLGIKYREDLLEMRFGRNTSFRNEKERAFRFSRADRLKIRAVGLACDAVPLGILARARRRLGERNPVLVSGTFASIRDEQGLG